MSRRAFTLPIRSLSSTKQSSPQWICKRCLATQIDSTATPFAPAASSSEFSSTIPGYDPSLPASKRIGPDGKPYRLTKSDFNLKKPLPQPRIPIAYLQHSTSDILHENEKKQRENVVAHKKIVGVVVSSGKMAKTVKVRVATRTWNQRIGKYYKSHENFLTHDPNSSLVEGDVVELHRLRVSRRVGHVVASIVSPFGAPVEERPHILSPDERLAAYKAKRFEKLKRRTLRQKAADGDADAIKELKSMGLDPGSGTESGVGKGNVQPQVGKSRNPGKGAVLGEKGQKLPAGVLPSGQHEVGKINDRAKHNKDKAMKFDALTKDRLFEAEQKGDKLEQRHNISSDSALR